MAELYSVGTNRVYYKAIDFAIGKTVTAYFWSPTLVKSELQTFTEIELGQYYLDYDFAVAGSYLGLFYEDGVKTTQGVFRITPLMEKLDSAMELDGAVYRFTENALEMAPGGGGDLLSGIVEGTITLRQALTLFLAILTGKSSGGGTATITFRDTADAKNRLVVTVDSLGNRTAVITRDGT